MPITMPVRRYAICDECEDDDIPLSVVGDRERLNFNFEQVIEDGPFFQEIEGWVVKAFPDPNDPIVVQYEYYCPKCVIEEEIEDSGDRPPADTSSNG